MKKEIEKMKKKKKIIAIVIVLIMGLSLVAACGGGDSGPAQQAPPQPGQGSGSGSGSTVVGQEGAVVGGGEPVPDDAVYAESLDVITEGTALAVLNPFNAATNTTTTQQVFIMIYDRLVNNLGEGNFGPSLATSWDPGDFRTIRMTLRDDVYFHNGEKFTAEDIEATIIASREGVGSQSHDIWRVVESVRVLSPTEIEFTLNAVNVDFFTSISHPHASILNKSAIESGTERDFWIGTGAFSVRSFSSNEYAAMERNENYWGDVPRTKNITFRNIPEMSTRTIMLQTGEVQISMGTPADDVPMFAADPNYSVFELISNNPHYISFNMNDPVTGDHNFRMAVAHAVNLDELAMAGAGAFAVGAQDGSLYGLFSEFRNTDIPKVPHDPDKAREFLAASNYTGEPIEISTGSISTVARAAEMLQEQLQRVGINTTVNVMDLAGFMSYASYRDNQSQMTVYILPTTLSASHMRNAFFPGSGLNRASYNNPEIASLLDMAPTITDLNARRDHYLRLQEIVAEDMPYIMAFWRLQTLVVADGVGGVILSPMAFHDLRNAYMVVG